MKVKSIKWDEKKGYKVAIVQDVESPESEVVFFASGKQEFFRIFGMINESYQTITGIQSSITGYTLKKATKDIGETIVFEAESSANGIGYAIKTHGIELKKVTTELNWEKSLIERCLAMDNLIEAIEMMHDHIDEYFLYYVDSSSKNIQMEIFVENA